MLQQVLKVKRAQRGDKDAFISLIRMLESELYSLAKSILKSDEDCATALYQATLQAYKAIPELKKPKNFKVWIIKILIHECHELLHQRDTLLATTEMQEEQAELHQRDNPVPNLQQMVDELDDSLRIVIELFYRHKLTMKQMANVLNISLSEAKMRLYQARGALANLEKERKLMAYETI